jgi:predicted DCC family thiol-disulfide oxidoreductase YuxK
MNAELLVIYDGNCRFCRWGIEWIGRLDRRGVFDFCPFGHPVAEERLSVVPADTRHEQMHVAVGDRLLSGTKAARAILRELPFGRPGVALGLHRTYPVIVRLRWMLGRVSPDRPAPVTCGKGRERTVATNV